MATAASSFTIAIELHHHAAQASATAYCLRCSLTPSISTLMKSRSIFAELSPLLLLPHHLILSASIAGQPMPLSDASVSHCQHEILLVMGETVRFASSPSHFVLHAMQVTAPFNSRQTSGRAANQREVRRCPYPTPRSPLRRSNSNFIGRDAQLCQRYPIP